MADLWGALAQSAPGATTLTDAYTVPAGKVATVEVIACNRGSASSVRVAHAVAGEADATKQYVLFDYALADNDAITTKTFAVSAGDVVRVYSSSGDVSFTVNGIEEDA